jgi:hypothetical protein
VISRAVDSGEFSEFERLVLTAEAEKLRGIGAAIDLISVLIGLGRQA